MNAKRTFGVRNGLLDDLRQGRLMKTGNATRTVSETWWQLSISVHNCSGQRVLQNLWRKDVARRNITKMKKKIILKAQGLTSHFKMATS